jgi:hypothetical protein
LAQAERTGLVDDGRLGGVGSWTGLGVTTSWDPGIPGTAATIVEAAVWDGGWFGGSHS